MIDKKFLNFEMTSNLFLEFLNFLDYLSIVSYERRSGTEVNATYHAQTTSDTMSTIPRNLDSKLSYVIVALKAVQKIAVSYEKWKFEVFLMNSQLAF